MGYFRISRGIREIEKYHVEFPGIKNEVEFPMVIKKK